MDSVKHGNSETSSDENDQPEKFNRNNTSTVRSYECTFCKRGFTNAQALGGHMNIHRKDKAKAKQNNQQSPFPNKPKDDYMSTTSRYFAPISNEQAAHYHAALEAQMNYQFYFPASNPCYPHAPYQQSENHSLHEGHLGPNLSLQIGPSGMEDGTKEMEREEMAENEVDLELRLGHDP